jgi:hypothetical protein
MVELRWVLTRKTFPALAKRTRRLYIAFDGETSVGRVYRIEAGQQHGTWKWSMTALRSNADPASPTMGTADSKEEAKRHVEEGYDELARRSRLD